MTRPKAKPKRKTNPASLYNLRSTPKDGAKDLEKISVRIPKALLDGLSKLPGDRSVKIRAAIAQYLAENKSQNPP